MLGALLLGADGLVAQSADDLLTIEIAAARRAVSAGNLARNMIQVEGAYASPRVVPGVPIARARPTDRTAAILDAVVVPSTYRRPYGETLLILSEPQVSGNTAEVTTTLYRMSPSGRRHFETLLVTLRRTSSGWAVTTVEQLGAG